MTLAVIGIIVAIALPTLTGMKRHQQLKSIADAVLTDIRFGRSEAARLSVPVRLRFSDSMLGSCYLLEVGDKGRCECRGSVAEMAGTAVCTNGTHPLKLVWLPRLRGVTVQSNWSSITFDPRLGTVTPAPTISIANDEGEDISQVVSSMGRIRTCTRAPGSGSLPRCDGKKAQ
ncbi:GspH/FimT family pseudopilin [Roseateles agri]|uniref:GspH/FimT family pseudopilin n=1 Tax=Roseateles agri TaxID=3098619 RepID=UPI002A5983E8|nr:GspH/FimT family pseudopilin [Paucibacter sp. R3-3]